MGYIGKRAEGEQVAIVGGFPKWSHSDPDVCAEGVSSRATRNIIVQTWCHKIVYGAYTVASNGSITLKENAKLVVLDDG